MEAELHSVAVSKQGSCLGMIGPLFQEVEAYWVMMVSGVESLLSHKRPVPGSLE